ncbi:hypothetical protein QVD17_15415 [Tagetes erecta]|uniref:Uncharacterized protein n=1 Tax=Tagetes erecta TaxID=13708 RepID=A0AAD8NZM4_TARER|nr:hypothetical protein QVD17_15415 [Tagetes erecta]
MDTEVNGDESGVSGLISCKSIDKLVKDYADMETDDGLRLFSSPSVDDGGFDLRPVTPESNKETSDLMSGFTSPLTFVSSPLNTGFDMKENDDVSPSTPKAAVFDPFAPGPDVLMLAPRTMKCVQESRSYVERKLNFNSVMTKNDSKHVSETALEDNDNNDSMLIQAIYDSLLECIVSKHAEDVIGEISAVDSNPDAPMTPPFAPRLIGIAETCPNAPMKLGKKSRYIDLGLISCSVNTELTAAGTSARQTWPVCGSSTWPVCGNHQPIKPGQFG